MADAKPPHPFNFDADNLQKEWTEWILNFNIYLLASKRKKEPDEVKIAVLLNQLGPKAVDIYTTLKEDAMTTPESDELTKEDVLTKFDEVIKAFNSYFAPRKNIIHERCKFNKSCLASGQSLIEFVTILKIAAATCEFAERNNMVRDRLVSQIPDTALLNRMLDEGDKLTLDRAIELCKYYESRKTELEDFQQQPDNPKIDDIRQKGRRSHKGYNSYAFNDTAHTEREPDEILSVGYDDGKWSKPYYDCGGGNIWMLTYTVPFFGYINDSYFFKGTSGIDIDLRRVDIDQCPLPRGSTQLNIFAASDKCKKKTTECIPVEGLGFRRGSYKCVCKRGFYYPDTKALHRYYNGTQIEEEYEKLMLGEVSEYNQTGVFECLACAEGCEVCMDGSPCVVSLNWLLRTAILALSCLPIFCLPFVLIFTWKYTNVKVVRAASPVLLRVIVLGAFFIYCTTIVMYPRPNIVTCTARVWLREIGFSLTYGALMLKTWRISVIFRVRSAKAVKITDIDLLKRLGMIVAVFSVLLVIRTLVAPPKVIVGKTADDLKAYLCQTDWWDHSFTILEVLFLIWGIRLCIVVRKAPSEFNESRFISMAIYNEFLLSLFLNISMLFLQSPANPDLLYIIFFCHTQMTVTLLLCFIFGSKAYLVFKGLGKSEDTFSTTPKVHITKFLNKPRSGNSQYAVSTNSSTVGAEIKLTEQDVQDEFKRLYLQLEQLKEKNMRHGNRHLAARINAMQEAGRLKTADENEETSLVKSEEITSPNKTSCHVIKSDDDDQSKPTDISSTEVDGVVTVLSKKNGKPPEATVNNNRCTIEPSEGSTMKSANSGRTISSQDGNSSAPSKIASKIPIHLNLDDTSRFTEEVTV